MNQQVDNAIGGLDMGDAEAVRLGKQNVANATLPSPTNNPASLEGKVSPYAQIASMSLHATPEDAQDGGGYTREELVEVALRGCNYNLSGNTIYRADMKRAIDALIAIGAVR